jgi:CRP/FNR family cyclic AMP-dependent transcriptional regulator
MKIKRKLAFDADAFLRSAGAGKTIVTYQCTDVIFSQGDASDSVLYIQKGAVKLSVLSHGGKEAVVAMLGPGDFFGERALTGHPVRLEAATALTATTVLIVPKQQMIRRLHDQHALSDRFITYMLARNLRVEADLVDQLFNSSEKRLARTLLLLARYGKPDQIHRVLPRISHQSLEFLHKEIYAARASCRPFPRAFPRRGSRSTTRCSPSSSTNNHRAGPFCTPIQVQRPPGLRAEQFPARRSGNNPIEHCMAPWRWAHEQNQSSNTMISIVHLGRF